MNSASETKKWAAAEAQIRIASQFLENPNAFTLEPWSLGQYQHDTRELELRGAMRRVESLALELGCKPSLWKRLQTAAITMEETDRVRQYEEAFHAALSTKFTDDEDV